VAQDLPDQLTLKSIREGGPAMAKKSKAKARKRSATKDLAARDAKHVKGGGGAVVARKAGKGQQEFLVVKMNDVIITSVSP
jgi:hypothetical protein